MKPAQLLRKLEKNGVFRFTASIDVGGVPIHVEILTGIRFARITFAVGFAFDRESFGKVAEKLSGIGVDFLDKLGLELEVLFHYVHFLYKIVIAAPQVWGYVFTACFLYNWRECRLTREWFGACICTLHPTIAIITSSLP